MKIIGGTVSFAFRDDEGVALQVIGWPGMTGCVMTEEERTALFAAWRAALGAS